MSKIVYDIFISYRRDGGGATAGRINDMLTADGYSVSYDVDTLREGRFDMQLLERIEQCQDFILVVDKNCFVRTVDQATNPLDDWLWQELSYALQLKKNVIPVLLAGANFPQNLPEDIDNVRLCHGPKCVHEYFDSFYTKLKEMLRAYPRLAKPTNVGSTSPMKNMACLKLKADIDCIFYLDGEERSHLKAGIIQKIPLAKGEYELVFVSEENSNDRLELQFVMPDVDKLQKVDLCDIRDARMQKEAEAKNAFDKLKLFLVKQNSRYGFVDEHDNVVIPCKWWDANNFSEGLAPVQNATDYMWGFIDKTGSVVIPFKWHSAFIFCEGLASVKDSSGKYGYIDKTGNLAVPCMWKETRLFSEGLASVKDSDGKYGFIDKNGHLIVPCIWDSAYDFSDGLSCVKDANGKYGYIDKTGTLVSPCNWDDAHDYREGMARVKSNGKYGYIDNTGALVIPYRWDYADVYFCKGKARVEDPNGKEYYIDKTGDIIEEL